MTDIQVWNDKVILHPDGWGYRITEGDEGEIVIKYFEETSEGRKETDFARLYKGEMGERLLNELQNKMAEME